MIPTYKEFDCALASFNHELLAAILEQGFDLSARNAEDQPFFFEVIDTGDEELILTAMRFIQNPKIVDKFGWTAAQHLATSGSYDLAKVVGAFGNETPPS